ncbi:hypothetical protein PVK06_048583 [Gossypium arboreum]|uniref:MULE transposase domain-containing protein n=1 Tax=Gossypium arboreum TaxID=29729 RepID=A0ABR0MGM6_GOSAR|nr:hypothetical protein PVK06_048583 [Gossypium arboreum]
MKSKNFESWQFFLKNLRRHVVRQDNINIICDRSKGLLATIRHSRVPWRTIYCIRHIVVNIHKECRNKDWRREIMNMGYELEPRRFK